MKNQNLMPIKMHPYLKETIWGGEKLAKLYFKEGHNMQNIAESWELSAIEGKVSHSEDGRDFSCIYSSLEENECPVLIKLIDSKNDLSVQVHPHKKAANALPKNECWYILEADENAKIAYGFKEGLSEEEIKKSLLSGRVEEILNFVSVKSGDFFYVPAGLVHAIGAGITLLEIQQSSDTTYRLYDYNRRDRDGNKRELHIEKGLSAIKNFTAEEIASLRFSNKASYENTLCGCEFFSVIQINRECDFSLFCTEKPSSVTFLSSGFISLDNKIFHAKKGETFFIPKQEKGSTLKICSNEAIFTLINTGRS